MYEVRQTQCKDVMAGDMVTEKFPGHTLAQLAQAHLLVRQEQFVDGGLSDWSSPWKFNVVGDAIVFQCPGNPGEYFLVVPNL